MSLASSHCHLCFTLSHTSYFLGRIQIRPSQRTLSNPTARTTFNLTLFRTLEGGWLQFKVIIVLDCVETVYTKETPY